MYEYYKDQLKNMANFLNTKIALRTDTIQKWNSLSNQVLLNGEVAIVMTDEKLPLFKIGDGVHKFYELPYSNSKISSDMVNAIDIIAKSICQGANSSAVPQSLAAGFMVSSDVPYSQAFGYNAKTKTGDIYSFTWSGEAGRDTNTPYGSHAVGSFNINPNNGLCGVYIGEDNLSNIINNTTPTITINGNKSLELGVEYISEEEYNQLVVDNATLSNTVYIISSDYIEVYGQQIKNLAPGTDLSDAVNVEQLLSAVDNVQIPTDLSSFTNSPGYLVSNDISNYYQKSETSSATEIAEAIDSIRNMISTAMTSTYEYTQEEIEGDNNI